MTPEDTIAKESLSQAVEGQTVSPVGDRPLRVLQVMASMNRGGAENMVMNMYRRIDRDRIQFDFVVHTEDQGHFDSEIEALGGNLFHAPRYRGRNHIAYARWWNRFFALHPEYHLVHGHVRSTAAIYLSIAKRHGLGTIAHSHSTTSGRGLESYVKNVLQWPIRHIADHLLACSRDAAVWLFGKRAAERAQIVANAVDVHDFAFNPSIRREMRHEFGLDEEYVIGHVGRFHPVKNHRFLISLLAELVRRGENVILLLVGDGELRTSFERRVAELEIGERVRLLGIRDDAARIMQAMDCLVLPSLKEGFPVVLVEAQAAGLPCMVSDFVTAEAAITDLVEFKALSSGVASWADRLMGRRPSYMRSDHSEAIATAGFDSLDLAASMTDLYFGITPTSSSNVRKRGHHLSTLSKRGTHYLRARPPGATDGDTKQAHGGRSEDV